MRSYFSALSTRLLGSAATHLAEGVRLTWLCGAGAKQAVLNNVNQDTFGDYLDVASSRRLQRLEAKCIDFLLANFEKVRLFALSAPHTNTHPRVVLPTKEALQKVGDASIIGDDGLTSIHGFNVSSRTGMPCFGAHRAVNSDTTEGSCAKKQMLHAASVSIDSPAKI